MGKYFQNPHKTLVVLRKAEAQIGELVSHGHPDYSIILSPILNRLTSRVNDGNSLRTRGMVIFLLFFPMLNWHSCNVNKQIG